MALIETWVNCHLGDPVNTRHLEGDIFSSDDSANLFGVNVLNADGSEASITGTPSAEITRPDGNIIAVQGLRVLNKCWIQLPQEAYAVPGTMVIDIRLTNGYTVTGLVRLSVNVFQSVSGTVIQS